MGVTAETEPTFSVGNPEVRVDGDYVYAPGQGRNWDISPDGQRFLMLKNMGQSGIVATIRGDLPLPRLDIGERPDVNLRLP